MNCKLKGEFCVNYVYDCRISLSVFLPFLTFFCLNCKAVWFLLCFYSFIFRSVFPSSSDRFSCWSCFSCLFQEDSVSSWTQPRDHIWPQSMHAPKSTGSYVSLLCYILKSGRCQFVWQALVVFKLFGWVSTQMLFLSEWVSEVSRPKLFRVT